MAAATDLVENHYSLTSSLPFPSLPFPSLPSIPPSILQGILPLILDELLAARKRAKKDMAAATDPMEKAVQV